MSKLKILIAALILGLGGTGAYLIIAKPFAQQPLAINDIHIKENNPVGIENNDTGNEQNLTELLAKKIGEGIVKENVDGFLTAGREVFLSAPKAEDMAQQLLQEAQKNFDINNLRPVVSISSLKISEDTSRDALIKYFESSAKIISEAAQKMPDSLTNSQDLQISDFVKIKEAYEYEVNALYALGVPKTALEIHKKAIELVEFKKNIYAKLAEAEKDPLTAALAFNGLPNLDQEFSKLESDANLFIKENITN